MSSKDEELYDNSCEDENAEMAMLSRRYKKLAFQRDQRMGRRNFRRDRFQNDPSRNNQITCYGCKTFEIGMSNEQGRQERQG